MLAGCQVPTKATLSFSSLAAQETENVYPRNQNRRSVIGKSIIMLIILSSIL